MPVSFGSKQKDREKSLGQQALFVRIDDFGALTDSMRATFDILLSVGLKLHIAVVPAWLTADGARFLNDLNRDAPCHIEIGQHGYSHIERCVEHRRFEVGPGMSASEQRAVISRGQRELRERLDFAPSPVFVPPFNGFDQITVSLMAELGFNILSAGYRPSSIHFPVEVRELSINVDVLKNYFPPKLKDIETVREEMETVAARESHVGMLLHPNLMPDLRAWISGLSKKLVYKKLYKSFTLCELSEAMEVKKACIPS